MKRLKIFLLLLVVPAFLVISCKKDEPEPEVEYKSPTAAGRTTVVDVPAGLTALAETDVNASIVVAYFGLANFISTYASSFIIPATATEENKKSTSKVYTWSYQGYSYWMTYTVLADKYTWTYDWQTPEMARFTFISAEELKTGKAGSWAIYDPETPATKVWDYDWSINASNTFMANLSWVEGQEVSSFVVNSNADHSGNFTYNINTEKEAEINWVVNGSGTYWLRGYPDPVIGSWQ